MVVDVVVVMDESIQQSEYKDYLSLYNKKYFDTEFILKERKTSESSFNNLKKTHPIVSKIEGLSKDLNLESDFFKFYVDTDGVVVLDLNDNYKPENLVEDETKRKKVFASLERIDKYLKAQCPWKKGPFKIAGTFIDAEWRSDLKWNRIFPYLGKIEDQRICDLGCNNGYFMYRLASYKPKMVVGIETFVKYRYIFDFIRPYIDTPLYWESFSAECIRGYHSFFDTVLCMGLLYHMRDPVSLLHSIHNSLVKGGKLILESSGILSSESIALCPEGRYNGCSGIWYLPSCKCLGSWLKRADFKNIECFCSIELTDQEQRSTKWADIKSFSDFIDWKTRKTIEGYPMPYRFYMVANK